MTRFLVPVEWASEERESLLTQPKGNNMKAWKPSVADLKTIREAATQSAGCAVALEVGMRVAFGTAQAVMSYNILEVDDTPDWEKSDLYSPVKLEDFKKEGTNLVDGKAVLDFYVYSRGLYPELICNVVAHFEDGKLVKVS